MRSRLLPALIAGMTFGLVAAAGASTTTTYTTLLRVAFISPTRGVGLFETSTGPTPGHCVIYTRPTSDGGASFGGRGAPLACSRCGTGQAFSQVTFNSAGVLFAYGPGIAVSHDLGKTWMTPAVPGSVADLATRGRDAWMLVTRCHPGQRPCTVTLLGSPDGGTWRRVAEQPPETTVDPGVALYGELGVTSSLAAAPNGALVLALPRPPKSLRAPSPSTASVETLEPNTRTWRVQAVLCPSGPFETELSIAPDGSEWLACSSEPSTGVQPKGLATANETGGNWRVVARMCGLGTACKERMPLGGYLDGLAALNAHTAFYVGARSSLVGTFDGGTIWRTWQQIGGEASGTAQVTFVDRHNGWAVALNTSDQRTSLWRTTNGGRTWSVA